MVTIKDAEGNQKNNNSSSNSRTVALVSVSVALCICALLVAFILALYVRKQLKHVKQERQRLENAKQVGINSKSATANDSVVRAVDAIHSNEANGVEMAGVADSQEAKVASGRTRMLSKSHELVRGIYAATRNHETEGGECEHDYVCDDQQTEGQQ